jgi:predicted ATP-grasp superfamily ATP-dependent carboligase
MLIFDIHISVHHNIITDYSQHVATFVEFISTDAVHVSGGSSAHHQEHITVYTASGIVNQYCC